MRGRKPTPTALKVLAGNPGKRALSKNEPQPTAGAEMPEHLSPRAREVWEALEPEFSRLGLLNQLSGFALAGFCDSYARWLEATEEIRKTGEIVKAPSGYPIQNPWRAIANKAYDQWSKMAAEFGMTPSSITRVAGAAPPKPVASEWGRFRKQSA